MSQRGSAIVFVLLLITFLGLGLIFIKYFRDHRTVSPYNIPNPTNVSRATPLRLSGFTPTHPEGQATPLPRDLTTPEYTAISNELVNIVKVKTPKDALETLKTNIAADDRILRSCHPLVHEIGRAAYEKYNDFSTAIQYTDEMCNTGYMHGVIEARFAGIADITAEMQTICHGQNAIRCYHGVGHGVMFFTVNDLPKSIALCETYQDAMPRSNCLQGVYMENFNTDQKLHPSNYLKVNDPFYPCQEQKESNKTICYYYAPRYYVSIHKDQYDEALKWCRTAEGNHWWECSNGVGAIAIKLNMNDPFEVEQICSSAGKDQIAPCLDGMVGYYVYFYNSLEKGQTLCDHMDEVNQPTCRRALTLRPELEKN